MCETSVPMNCCRDELIFFQLLQKYEEGIRDRVYGFVKYSPSNPANPVDSDGQPVPKLEMALDISFGTSGYTLALARAFKYVRNYRIPILSPRL